MNGRDRDDGYPAVVCRLPAAGKAGVECTGPIAGKPAPTEGRSSHHSISGIGAGGRFYGFCQVLMWALAGPIAARGPLYTRSPTAGLQAIAVICGSWLASDSARSVTACIAGTPHNDLGSAGRRSRLASDADDEGAGLTAPGLQWSRQAALLKGPANRFQPSPGDHCEQTRCPSTWLSQRNQGAAAAWACANNTTPAMADTMSDARIQALPHTKMT